MPESPMAGSKAPMVVGRRQTYNAISTERSAPRPSVTDVPSSASMIMVNIAVKPIRTMVMATSFGVFGRLEDSTIFIIWSMKVSPGLVVIFAVKVSLARREPPIRASPGAFRTGADSPVTSDSSTMAIPSITSASNGTMSPDSMRTKSSFLSSVDFTLIMVLVQPSVMIFLLSTSFSIFRRLPAVLFACCSASASESVLNQTVMMRMMATSM